MMRSPGRISPISEKSLVSDGGCKGDGATDDKAAFFAYLTERVQSGQTLDGHGLTYKINSKCAFTPSNLPAGIRIRNAVFDFSDIPDADTGFDFRGSLGSSHIPTAVAKGDLVLSGLSSTSRYTWGDRVLLRTDDVWPSVDGTTYRRGQWFVLGTPTADTLPLLAASLDDYSSNLRLHLPSLVRGIAFEDCGFIGAGDGHLQIGVKFVIAADIHFRRCWTRKLAHTGISLFTTYNASATLCDFKYGDLAAGFAYGLTLSDCCEDIELSGLSGTSLRSVVQGGGTNGITRRVHVIGTKGGAMKASVVGSHASADDWIVRDTQSQHGNHQGQKVILWSGGSVLIDGVQANDAPGIVVGAQISAPDGYGTVVRIGGITAKRMGYRSVPGDAIGVLVNSYNDIASVDIDGVAISGDHKYSVVIETEGGDIDRLTIGGVNAKATSAEAILISAKNADNLGSVVVGGRTTVGRSNTGGPVISIDKGSGSTGTIGAAIVGLVVTAGGNNAVYIGTAVAKGSASGVLAVGFSTAAVSNNAATSIPGVNG